MGSYILLLVIVFGVMFCLGIASGIVSFIFAKKGKHPVISIVLSVICWLGVCISIKFTIGFSVYRLAMILLGIFSVIIIIMSIKNRNKMES